MPHPPTRACLRAASGLAVALALLAPLAPIRAETRVDEFRAKLEQWVETRQILSQERSDWEAERETLRASRKLLRQEIETLQAEVKELEESTTASDEERRDLLLERGESQRKNRLLAEQITDLEAAVLSLAPRLPGPLQDKLELLLVQIPEDPEATGLPLGQRLMNVLGVLAQAEKFNGTATFVGETRAVDGDQKVQIRTLYWGLGQAVYVDAQGRAAGIGRPTAEGWVFENDSGLASRAKRLLDIYEGNIDSIEFVKLPVEIR